MAEILEKLPHGNKSMKIVKQGAQIGVLIGLTEAGQFIVYPIPLEMALISLFADIVAFGAAALAYSRLDAHSPRVKTRS